MIFTLYLLTSFINETTVYINFMVGIETDRGLPGEEIDIALRRIGSLSVSASETFS